MVDTEDQLSLPGLCRILQDAAWKHAAMLGFGPTDLDRHGLMWILSRLLVRVEHYPLWSEDITVETWPSGVDRLFAMRDFRLSCGNRRVALVRSAWLAVDARSRRPARPQQLMDVAAFRDAERVFDELPPRLEFAPDPSDTLAGHTVVYSDFDRQRHVNNVQYLQWMLDAFPMAHLQANSAGELAICFLAEASYGETVSIRRRPAADEVAVFGPDGNAVCVARIRWRPRQAAEDSK